MKYPAYVYVITTDAAKFYIGMSANPKVRFARHKSLLQAGKHPVEDMQADYNASPYKHLHIHILDTVNSEGERWKEHKWQLKFRSYERQFGYNYKDPTARTEMAAAEQKKQVKATLKKRIQKFVYPHGDKPIPLSQKRHAEFLEECRRLGYIT